MIKIFWKIKISEFFKNTLNLKVGTTISMGVSIVISPILTRLYLTLRFWNIRFIHRCCRNFVGFITYGKGILLICYIKRVKVIESVEQN